MMFTNALNMGSKLRAWVEKTVYSMEIHWLSADENKFMLNMKGPIFWWIIPRVFYLPQKY